MREAQEFPENSGANDAASANPNSSDASNTASLSFDDIDTQSATSNDLPGNGKSERIQDNSASNDASVASQGDNANNDASTASQSDGVNDAAATSLPSKVPRNIVFVNPNKKKTSRKIAIVILCVTVIVLILLLCLRFFTFSSDVYDPNTKEGVAPNKTKEEIQEEMSRKIEKGMFVISIYSIIRFPDSASEGEANIANVPNNNFDMRIFITENATGDILYESGIIKPNSYIDKIRLSKNLDPGTYEATATFHTLDRETHEERGMTNAKVTIYVES